MLAHYLKNSNASYALAIDADVGVVNPFQRIENYIDSRVSLTFYERFRTFEIAASSFIVKNNAYGYQFLMEWARSYQNVPLVEVTNSDNGALLVSCYTSFSLNTLRSQYFEIIPWIFLG